MMSLYQKHRPRTLKEFCGNKKTVKQLRGILSGKSIPHAFLFCGPSGCGKTTLARIVARDHFGCKGLDLQEIDSADFRGIDTVRTIRDRARLKPSSSPVRVWILDECHMMTKDAQNALLKALEDPPEHAYFMLCTTEPKKLINTIRSRCTAFTVAPLSHTEMAGLLKSIAKKEKVRVPDDAINKIYDISGGLVRESVVMLEKILRIPSAQMVNHIEAVEMPMEAVELCRALLKGDSWKKVSVILKRLKGQDPEGIRRLVLGYMTTVLLNSGRHDVAYIIECFSDDFYSTGYPGLVMACFEAVESDA